MCKLLSYILVVILCNSFSSYAYNKARLVRLEIQDNPNFKVRYGYHEDVFLEFTERTAKYGYKSEAHVVVTEDGCILTIYRFLKRAHCDKLKQPPVILQHGISGNSMNWLDPGPKYGLPYLLANECYDMWLTNSRGTTFSRNHTKLNPDKDPEYWQFSHHEMGFYDNPAVIDYILKKTDNVKINHISHSQGSAALLITACVRPEYMDKINSAIMMGPASWLTHVKSDLRWVANYWKLLYAIFDGMGFQEVVHKHSLIQEALLFVCHSKAYFYRQTCLYLVANAGRNEGSIDPETLTVMFAHTPDGISLKNLIHLAQIITTREFKPFDYENENLKYYGRNTPPIYNVSNISTPISILYSETDLIVNQKDVKMLRKHLNNVTEFYKMPHPKWTHFDFSWSKHIPTLLLPKINQLLLKYTYGDSIANKSFTQITQIN